ncbi:50S ribosomal protein L13 [bacterium]|nr:50S ribosomal protein L13 [bacterium]MBU1637985.1 50S ribosomal protein L13 [bacterium]MBU1920907.1 50S ribosomal protein L13 [bacterium]
MSTFHANSQTAERNWVVVDATGQTLGRLCSRIASILRGKHKPTYTPHCDTGDFVIVVNADKYSVTSNKESKKVYFRHTGYPGGGRYTKLSELQEKHPERVIERAVKGMLPHTRLGRKQFRKLKVYTGSEHPHEAQQPIEMSL